jgi:hypothetical protein
MTLPFFRRQAAPAQPTAPPEVAPEPRPFASRFFRLRRRPAEPVAPSPPQPPRRSRALLLTVWHGIKEVGAGVDEAFNALALPFGVRIANPTIRYAVMLGLFALVYLLGALPLHIVPLVALGCGYVGVLAIGRAWVRNEKKRTAIVKKLDDTDPDSLPDLRWTALVAALQLLVLFPLLFMQVQRHFGWYRLSAPADFWDWLWFSLDKTYLKALPDWSILYGVHISSIDFDAAGGRHLVLLCRLTFDWVLIQGVLRLLAIRGTIREAVAAVKADPEMAVRLGMRAVGPLVEKLSDPDRAVRGAAANALTQLGEGHLVAAAAGREQVRLSSVTPT